MIRLSIIIVNYNVKYFLEQSIRSCIKACAHIPYEIMVIDNNSSDGSVAFMQHTFPDIHVIANTENVGFSRANNQGIEIAKGAYILLLNPDTVVEEDTFEKCLAFMDAHADAGGLGVKMIDGKGNFLPESKRAFPSPEVAFYKAFGLANLFPHSRVFGKYHLGYLDENTTHEVDVLAGAFMLLRASVLHEIGYLDPVFFMYGEDIDLSYRIVQHGYKNYYFPETRIIHYKGESTKKASFNYVRMFYTAMKIFARKHFSGGRKGFFVFLLNIAITFRAMLASVSRFFKQIALPLLDVLLFFGSMFLIKEYWEYYVKYIAGGTYPPQYMYINVPIYILIWIFSIYLSGGYDKGAGVYKILRGIFWGTLVIAALYGFLPESLRFSRGMIVAGAALNAAVVVAARILLHFLRYKNLRFAREAEKKIAIVGSAGETTRTADLLQRLHLGQYIVGYIRPEMHVDTDPFVLGNISDLQTLTDIYQINEVIFCARDISSTSIMEFMVRMDPRIDFKILPEQSFSIIGSNSKDTAGDIYTIDIQLQIAQAAQKRNKRILDLFTSIFLLVCSPVLCLLIPHAGSFLRNCFQVLGGRKTWVGYVPAQHMSTEAKQSLPALRPGVLHPLMLHADFPTDEQTIQRINLLYARDYHTSTDLSIIRKNFRSLGNK
ncbi:MAG: glycosyltransferase [Chitinophagales bacterium]